MKRTRIVLIVGILLGAGGLFLAGASLQAKPGDTLNPPVKTSAAGPAIEQPINYSHKLHAGKLGIDCAYCHTNVDKSSVANIPNVETCMNCHKWVKRATGQTADSPEIAKIADYYEKGQPIPWKNVHFLPEHANFSHKRHVKAGVSCLTCHGNIPEMDVVYPVYKLEMGFCVQCHKDNREHPKTPANVDCLTCHK
jgi:hypothetical protein